MEMRLPDASTMGSLPLRDLARILLASWRVTPSGAVTRSVTMTSETVALSSSSNWRSRLVTIPSSLEPSLPSSVSGQSHHPIQKCLLKKKRVCRAAFIIVDQVFMTLRLYSGTKVIKI